ncbi:MAG: silent information regulator protein Sir2 [Draconibacterium sp.]
MRIFITNRILRAGAEKLACNLSGLLLILFFIFLTIEIKAQDARERLYNYPVLNPNHAPKPKVEGWANKRVSENMDRGLVAFKTSGGIYLSWRFLGRDANDVAFDVYAETEEGSVQKLNKEPISKTSDYFVAEGDSRASYFVKTNKAGGEETQKKVVPVNAGLVPYKSIAFQGDYSPDRVAVGDLNGDGEYDFVIKQPGGRVDPGVWRKSPDTFKLEAYLSDGTFLWRKDLGWNIEQGIWYSPFIVYDFNGDGKAEIAVKTAPTDQDFRDEDGRVFDGPEYCSVLDGMTGKEIDRVDWPARNPRFGRYNRNNRNQMGMAYLDGKTPCLLVARGTYRLMMVDAYQLNNKMLEKLWHWDGDEENPVIRSQGAHSLHTIDVDNDGRDEIVLGSAVLDDDGTLLFSAGVGHSDKCFVTDIDPNRQGMEIFFANEVWHDSAGVSMVDAATGKQIWNINHYTRHVGNGMVADIMPEIPGLECFASEDSKAGLHDKYMLSASGEYLARNLGVPQCTNWIFWDADKVRESIEWRGYDRRRSENRGLSIVKYPSDTLSSEIQGAVMLMADLYGDWREELVTVLPGELRIYSTNIPASDRRITLMQDPLYRSDVVHRSMGYFQPPVTSYYLGE